MIWYNIIDL